MVTGMDFNTETPDLAPSDEHVDLFNDDVEDLPAAPEHDEPEAEMKAPAGGRRASTSASAVKERRRAQRAVVKKALESADRIGAAEPKTRAALALLLGTDDDTTEMVLAALDGAGDAKKVIADVESLRAQVQSDPFEAFAAIISFEASQRARFRAVWDIVAAESKLPKTIPANALNASKSLAQALGALGDGKLGPYRDAIELIG